MVGMWSNPDLANRISELSVNSAVAIGRAIEVAQPGFAPSTLKSGPCVGLYCGPGSPLTQVMGLLTDSPLSAETYQDLQSFYEGRTNKWEMQLGPFSNPDSWSLLQNMGWRVVGHEHTLYLDLDQWREPTGSTIGPGVEIRLIENAEREVWSKTLSEGFMEVAPSDTDVLTKVMAAMTHQKAWMAFVDSEPAAGGGLVVAGDVAMLAGSATKARFRGQGLQSALITMRLKQAKSMGCGLAIVDCAPGSQSHHNMERRGFKLAYSKAVLDQR